MGNPTDDVGWVTGAAGTILHTTDGGLTWTGIVGHPSGKPEIKFAGAVGWMCNYKTLTYTTDGGRHLTAGTL